MHCNVIMLTESVGRCARSTTLRTASSIEKFSSVHSSCGQWCRVGHSFSFHDTKYVNHLLCVATRCAMNSDQAWRLNAGNAIVQSMQLVKLVIYGFNSRRYASAYMLSSCVRLSVSLSVCLSVTSRSSTKASKPRIR